eukprot:6177768-Pyramimonas_sp.AAC.2
MWARGECIPWGPEPPAARPGRTSAQLTAPTASSSARTSKDTNILTTDQSDAVNVGIFSRRRTNRKPRTRPGKTPPMPPEVSDDEDKRV